MSNSHKELEIPEKRETPEDKPTWVVKGKLYCKAVHLKINRWLAGGLDYHPSFLRQGNNETVSNCVIGLVALMPNQPDSCRRNIKLRGRNISGSFLSEVDPAYFATVFEDISDRKKAEKSVKSSEKKYRLLVENAHDLIVVIQNGFVKFANPAALHTFGYAKEEIRTLSLRKIVHSEELRNTIALDWQNMETAQSAYHNFRGLTRSGQIR